MKPLSIGSMRMNESMPVARPHHDRRIKRPGIASACLRRLPWCGLLLAALACADQPDARTEAAPDAEAIPFLGGFLTDSRILYPLRIGDWQAQGEHRFEMAEMGASVRYKDTARADRWLDVYFYPAGMLPQGRLRKDVEQTVKEIAGVAQRPGGYDRIDIEPIQDFTISIGKGKDRQDIEAYSASMRFEARGKTYHSALVMLVKDLYYIKARMSVDADTMKQDKVRRMLEERIGELVRNTSLFSTGACWNPPPIVARASLDAKAEGALASNSRDGTLTAVAFADRIEATDAEAPEARVLQFLAASMTGRWAPGCLPPDDLTPPVPEGMRELRFEYRAPNEDSDGTTPRLRGKRTDVG